jgi:hypothetical protein
MSRYEPHGLLNGVPITTSSVVPDGTIYALGGSPPKQFILGTEWSVVHRAGWHARWLVQQGLIDVLEWLGEEPIPKHPNTLPPAAAGVMAALRRQSIGRYEDRPRPGRPF